jgi:hypothetical protein
MNQANPVQIQRYLSGVDYPANRDQLVEAAKSNNADKDTIELLKRLPDRTYDGPSGVSHEISQASG